MENYIQTIESCLINDDSATSKDMGEEKVLEYDGVPWLTSSDIKDKIINDIPVYMAPKKIEVKRYTLKK